MSATLESLLEPLTLEQQERLAVVLSQYMDDMEHGLATSPEPMVASNPDLAEPLREYVSSMRFLQRATVEIGTRIARPAVSACGGERQLGDYRLVREIGRGGMGVVYEARQVSLGRVVALKLLPFAALLDPKQIARFQNEAQAAARLHHPNIVSVFAVGCESGTHFYSMQFIDGQSLAGVIHELRRDAANQPVRRASQARTIAVTETYQEPRIKEPPVASDANSVRPPGLSRSTGTVTSRPGNGFSTVRSVRTRNYVRAAAELTIQAAEALQHAHESGVVHRDIKPSNLLVDRNGKLWVTDFGLARCDVGPDLTATGDVLGTLRYMSPEQAAGTTQVVDHRTDVYSLGVTLFEILALRPAFDGDDRTDVLRRIREESPRSLRELNPAVPYDLETIVLKAVAKSREDRYASAQEFRNDLRRFLAGEPALARRPTAVDRAVKWLARHSRLAAAAILVLVIGIASIASVACLLAARQSATDRALARARAHLRALQQVVDRFGAGMSEQLRDVPAAEAVRGQLLRDTLMYYDAILDYAGDDPLLRVDAAKASFKAGAVHEQIGETDRALSMYRMARERFEQMVHVGAGDRALTADLALCENNLGALLARLGRISEAENILRSAVARQTELVTSDPRDARYRDELALSQLNLGLALADSGRDGSAAACYRDAIRLLECSGGLTMNDTRQRHRLANAKHNLSGLIAKDDPVEAERIALEAVSLLRELSGTRVRADLALALANLGGLAHVQAKLEDAIRLLEEAASIQQKTVGEAPRVVAHRVDLAATHNSLGQSLLDLSDVARASHEFQAAQELFERLIDEYPDDPLHFSGSASALNNLGIIRERQGELEGAAEAFRRAAELQRMACSRAPRVERYRVSLARHQANLCRVLNSLGRSAEAERILQRENDLGTI